jgi:hypothetical protein
MKLNLTTALAVLGVAVLVLVLAQGWWSTRRAGARKRTATETQERIEPLLAVEPAAPGEAGLAALRGAAPRRGARLDALIDAIVPLTLDVPASGESALAHLPASRRVGTKPFYVEGLNADSGEWEAPAAGQSYREFQAGVQLASRTGALNEIEYSEFVQKVQAFADGVGALADFPDMLEVVARARELDAFASPLDAQLQLTLRANSVAWSVPYLHQCAARHGFVAGSLPGRLVLPSAEEGAPAVLALSYDPQAALSDEPEGVALREVQLCLDVPQIAQSAEPFPQWHRAATALAAELDATPVDDQGVAVTLHAFDTIGKELGQLYRSLEARDLGAGTPAARRLFSG